MTQAPVNMAARANRDTASTNAFAGKSSKEKFVKVRITRQFFTLSKSTTESLDDVKENKKSSCPRA